MIPIIDTHQHLWDLSKFHLAWLDGGGPLASSHLLVDYKRETEGLNIVKTIYMEVDVSPDQRVKEAEYVFDLCRQPHPLLAGAVIGGNPMSADFKEYVLRFRQEPHFKGVRQVLHGGQERGTCLKPEFVAGIHLLGEHRLIFDLCLRPDELSDGIALAKLSPHTQFVLDHCGNAPIYAAENAPERLEWKRGLAEMGQLPNVVCKISGIIAQLKKGDKAAEILAPSINACVAAFGHERVLFASDWPVCTLGSPLKDWVQALQTIVKDWPETDQRKLFHDNAQRIYGLHA